MQVWKILALSCCMLGCATTAPLQLGVSPPELDRHARAPDWQVAGPEAVAWLQDYLRVDTSNPPGHEARAADFLSAILAKEGIASERIEHAPGRQSLIARLPATATATIAGEAEKPLCLLAHTDVVTAEPAQWPAGKGPLSGANDGTYVWGRGALDMKGMGILELATLIELKRQAVPLRRPVVLLAVADEEVDNRGMRELVEKHWAKIGCSHLINEGGLGVRGVLAPGQTVFGISVAEKGLLWLRLTAHGKSGHGSTPLPGRAPDRLLDALEKLRKRELVAHVHPSVYGALAAAGKQVGGVKGWVLQRPFWVDHLALGTLMDEPGSRAMLTNTCSVTGFSGMFEPNVVPSEVSAQLDCRVLPGTQPADLLKELQAVVGDDQVSWQVLHQAPATESPSDDPLFRALARRAIENRSDAAVGPLLSVGFTDSMYARQIGVRAYGFVPIAIDRELAETMHGVAERIPIAEFVRGLGVLYRAVVDVAAAP